jgi:protein SCO1/2
MRFVERVVRSRVLRTLVCLLATLGGSLAANADGSAGRPLPIAAHYQLMDTEGRLKTESSFAGKWQLVFFGFTSCPDICPTTLLSVRVALKALGDAADHIQPIFITLDPQRDSASQLTEYLRAFSPAIIGLRGTEEEVRSASRAFRVYVEARSLGKDNYTVDHSAFLYLLDPEGHFHSLLSADLPGHPLADQLRSVMR